MDVFQTFEDPERLKDTQTDFQQILTPLDELLEVKLPNGATVTTPQPGYRDNESIQ